GVEAVVRTRCQATELAKKEGRGLTRNRAHSRPVNSPSASVGGLFRVRCVPYGRPQSPQNARPSVRRGAPQLAQFASTGAPTGGRTRAGVRRELCARPTSTIHTAQPSGTSTLRMSKPLSSIKTEPMMRTATKVATTTSDQRCMPARTTSTLATTSQSALALGAELTKASTNVVVVASSAGTAKSTPAAVHRTAARSAAATAHQLESALCRIATVSTSGASPYAITVAA